jgi:putative methionine-R-sulfoxide reductase with GAF domain
VGATSSPRGFGRLRTRDDVEAQLANLRSLTDTGLAHLDIDDLLDELLARTKEILDADTAAVLLLDETSHQLVARAASGIEAEVRQGVRIPLGVGFAGSIAARRGPIRLDHVDASTVANPILWETGINVMLGVPLLAGDDLVGVLHVGRLDDRSFTPEDTDLLEVVAERVAAATQAKRLSVERAAAELLERSLLPGRLPDYEELDFAARYVPAAGRMVGGDWYDAFTLPSGELWIVIGDVAGHSLQAAVIMGRVRSAFRSFSLLELAPHEVLRLVDRKIELFELDTTVTIACAVMTPPFDRMKLAIAGHPSPVIAEPDRDAAFASAEAGPVLGLGDDIERCSTEIPIPRGATVAFYTDGLVERRYEPIDEGLERLREAVFAGPSSLVVHSMMRQLIGSTAPEDDVAVLVFHTSGTDGGG